MCVCVCVGGGGGGGGLMHFGEATNLAMDCFGAVIHMSLGNKAEPQNNESLFSSDSSQHMPVTCNTSSTTWQVSLSTEGPTNFYK